MNTRFFPQVNHFLFDVLNGETPGGLYLLTRIVSRSLMLGPWTELHADPAG